MNTTQIMSKDPTIWLEELLKLMGYPSAPVALRPTDEPTNYWLEIDSKNWRSSEVQSLIGAQGEVIDAIQHLANATFNLDNPNPAVFYTIEIDGYRSQRFKELAQIAEKAAETARTSGQDYKIEHLTAAERRYIHLILEKQPDLKTESVGREPHRHLLVKLAG